MKLLARLILIGGLTAVLSFYFAWWIVIVISFIICFLIHGSYFNVFISGFLGVGLIWLGYAWILDLQTNSILSEKLLQLFPFNDTLYLIIGSGIIGAFAGGFGSLAGNSFRQLFLKKKTKSFYN